MSTRPLKICKRANSFSCSRLFPSDNEPSPSPSRSQPPSNALLGLPAEVKLLIFEQLADVPSLHALISTCSTLNSLFLTFESSIIAKVLQRRMHPSLMHNALAIIKSSEPSSWSWQKADNFITLYTKTDKSSLRPELTLRNAFRLSEMHDHVHFFAIRFATYALSQHPVTGRLQPQLVPPPISTSELCRIERTFYRFQFYCNLLKWRQKGLSNRCEISSIVCDNFAPWENEQLACIIDYLVHAALKGMCFITCVPTHDGQLIDLPFQDIRWCNIQRGTPMARFRNPWGIPIPAKCLPLGLAFLHRLVLTERPNEVGPIPFTRWFSGEVFFSSNWGIQTRHDRPLLSEMTKEEQSIWINRPTTYDGYDGPEQAWRWAYANHGPASWFNSAECGHLRRWGYVMWDLDHLNHCGVLGMKRKVLERRAGFVPIWPLGSHVHHACA